jgi:protein-S-isoprenylcysteine O-methyltransferase Ste14
MRFLPLAGVLALFAVAFCWRPWLQFRRHGNWGIVLFRGGWHQRLRDGPLSLVPQPDFPGAAGDPRRLRAHVADRASLLLLAGGYVGVRAQTSAEEAYLERAYGDAWRAYARRVGRFLPGLGRA